MTVTYGFYNSVGGDRVYDAEDISSMFDGVITDGVFEEVLNALDTTQNTVPSMHVIVKSGKAWFNHTWTLNDADLVIPVTASSLVNPRVDTVVLEVDATDPVRANSIKIIAGTPAGSPVPPTLINAGDLHQYPLAYIAVGTGVTTIVNANITKLVGTGLCPYVTVPQAGGGGGGAAVLEVQVFSS